MLYNTEKINQSSKSHHHTWSGRDEATQAGYEGLRAFQLISNMVETGSEASDKDGLAFITTKEGATYKEKVQVYSFLARYPMPASQPSLPQNKSSPQASLALITCCPKGATYKEKVAAGCARYPLPQASPEANLSCLMTTSCLATRASADSLPSIASIAHLASHSKIYHTNREILKV